MFWIIKIAATTLGETGGDTVTMTLNWGYLAGTALFLAVLAVLVLAQIAAEKFHPVCLHPLAAAACRHAPGAIGAGVAVIMPEHDPEKACPRT